MNITSLMPNYLKRDAGAEPTEAELDTADLDAKARRIAEAPKTGPRTMSRMTSGQYRRMVARNKASAQRKANECHRKAWMRNEHAVAALRGQLETVAAIKNVAGRYVVGQSGESMRIVHERLTAVYGSVKDATEHYESLLAERA